MRTIFMMIFVVVALVVFKPTDVFSSIPVFVFSFCLLAVLRLFGRSANKGDLVSDQRKGDELAQAAADAFVNKTSGGAAGPETSRTAAVPDSFLARVQAFEANRTPTSGDPHGLKTKQATKVDGEYVLFLRTFSTDAKFRVFNPRRSTFAANFIPLYSMILDGEVSLDDALRVMLKGKFNIFAIGAPENIYGAGKVRTDDENWKIYFDALAKNASAIILFAGLRPGTMWEIQAIARSQELQKKTIMIFPPKSWEGEGHDELPEIIKFLMSVGVDCSVPIEHGTGALMSDNRVTHVELLIAPHPTKVRKDALKSLIKGVTARTNA